MVPTQRQVDGVNIIPVAPHIHPLLLLDELLLSYCNDEEELIAGSSSPTASVFAPDKSILKDHLEINTVTKRTTNPVNNAIDKVSCRPDKNFEDGNNDRRRLKLALSQQRTFHILKGADFICSKAIPSGCSSSPSLSSSMSLSSLLECALEILDGNNAGSNQSEKIQDDESSSNHNQWKKYSVPVRLIRSVSSGRSFLIVQNNASSTMRKRRRKAKRKFIGFGQDINMDDDDVSECMCLIGNKISHRRQTNEAEKIEKNHPTLLSSSSPILAAGRVGFHCSCRFFFERLQHDRFAVCKHLLAARLAPFLHGGCYQEEDVSDEEFSALFLKYSLF